jgi:hypothetical protein
LRRHDRRAESVAGARGERRVTARDEVIETPLGRISEHVVQAERIRTKAPHRSQAGVSVVELRRLAFDLRALIAIRRDARSIEHVGVAFERGIPRRSGARRVLPLRFGRELESVLQQHRSSALPIDRQRNTSVDGPFLLGRETAQSLGLRDGQLVLRDQERRELDVVQRDRVEPSGAFVLVLPHREAAARQEHEHDASRIIDLPSIGRGRIARGRRSALGQQEFREPARRILAQRNEPEDRRDRDIAIVR